MAQERTTSPTSEELQGWFTGRLPDGWFTGGPEVNADREEILVVGTLPEPELLDTLVDSGVARSRSHALAWCVRLVAENQDEWLKDLRTALTHVEKVRDEGPA